MTKIPFRISAIKQGEFALVRITGTIGFDIDAETFRSQIDQIAAQGVTHAHCYINSSGGSCFDAAEIVNILKANFEKITGEGGALVASAATYIALHCNSFEMPENGMFMIHKPSGGTQGGVKDMESYTKLLKSIEGQYYDVYKKRATNAVLLNENWNNGDWWMTAQEAKENGFITGVINKTPMDNDTVAMIKACGCPTGKFDFTNPNNNLAQITKALGLKNNADMDVILSTIANLSKQQLPADVVKDAIKKGYINAVERNEYLSIVQTNPKTFHQLMFKRKEQVAIEQKNKIESTINNAIYEKRIIATAKKHWQRLLETDFETSNAALQCIEPLPKIEFSGSTAKGENRSGWTLDDYRINDPKALKNDPELFNRLIKKENEQ